MDYLLDGHPQGAVSSCQACEGTGYIDPEVSQGLKDQVCPTNDRYSESIVLILFANHFYECEREKTACADL